jgi:hypothetical protein
MTAVATGVLVASCHYSRSHVSPILMLDYSATATRASYGGWLNWGRLLLGRGPMTAGTIVLTAQKSIVPNRVMH